MPKHWGLQCQIRMENFSKRFVEAKLYEIGAMEDEQIAEQEVTRRRVHRIQSTNAKNAAERVLRHLMDEGPARLRRFEGDAGGPLSLEEFLAEMDKAGVR